MSKKQLTLLICVFLGFFIQFQLGFKENYRYNRFTKNSSINTSVYTWECDAQGNVSYIVDGDTFDVNLLGRIRLADIDTPEVGEYGYQEAKDYLNSSIFNKNLCLDIDDIYGTGPYGRIIAVAYIRYNSTHYLNINKDLLERGYANISNYDNEFNPYEWTLYVANNINKADIKPFPLFLFLSLNNNVNKSNFKVTYFGIFGIIFLILNITAALIIIIYYKIHPKSSKKKRIKATSYDFNNYFPKDNFKKVKIKANIRAESNKALLLNFGENKDYWIPKLAIHSNFTNNLNSPQIFIIDNWILKRNKITGDNFQEKDKIKIEQLKENHSNFKKNTTKNAHFKIEGIIMHTTDKALLIRFKNGQEEWIPKSLIHSKYNLNYKIPQLFIIESWILKKKNLDKI